MSEAIVKYLTRIIVEDLDVNFDVDQIDPQTSLFEDGLGLDSFAIVELISLVEAHFGFEFDVDELLPCHFETIHTFATLVAGKVADSEVA